MWECLRTSGKETRLICDSHENPPLHINWRIHILDREVRCINTFHAEYLQEILFLVRCNVLCISESVRNRGKKIRIRITERCDDVERQNVKLLWERGFRYYYVTLWGKTGRTYIEDYLQEKPGEEQNCGNRILETEGVWRTVNRGFISYVTKDKTGAHTLWCD